MVRRLLLSLLPFQVCFPTYFNPLFPAPLSLSQTSNTSSKQSKKKSDNQTIHSNRLSSFHLGTHLRSSLQQVFLLYYTCLVQKLLYTSKPLKSEQKPSCPIHYAEPSSNIPFTGWIRQRYSNTISVSCRPCLDGGMLSSCSGTQLEELNMNILILMFLLRFLAAVLVNVFLWPVSATGVV